MTYEEKEKIDKKRSRVAEKAWRKYHALLAESERLYKKSLELRNEASAYAQKTCDIYDELTRMWKEPEDDAATADVTPF